MVVTTLPPGPKAHWLRGNILDFRNDRLDFFLRSAHTYGDLVAMRFGPRRVFLVCHPDLIEQVLVSKNQSFIKHYALRLNPLVFGKGLLTSEGDFWLRQRRLIQPAFARGRIASYAGDMVEAARHMVAEWQPGATRDIYTEMMRLTLAITVRTLFGSDVDDEAVEVGQALQVLQEHFIRRLDSLVPLPMWLPTPTNLRIRRVVRRLDDILFRFIRRRRESGVQGNDLLSMLLHARDEDGSQMSDQQLRDEAMTLFLAGHETTALALSWTWYLLSQHPEAEERVAAQVREVLGDRLPRAEDVPRLGYLEQVVLESMRVLPPIYTIGREARENCELGGYTVPRGTTLLLSQWVLHHDPRFFEDPDEFRPERWTAEFHKQLPKFAYFPFGGGPRLCIGNTFAIMEMVLVLAIITQRFRFTLQPGHPVEPWASFTLRPRFGILAPLTRRVD